MATQFNWKQQGDVVNLIVVINSLVYLRLLSDGTFWARIHGPPLRCAMGFISQPTPYPLWNSHMLSFYAEVK